MTCSRDAVQLADALVLALENLDEHDRGHISHWIDVGLRSHTGWGRRRAFLEALRAMVRPNA